MQEQNSNLENIIDTAAQEIKRNIHSLCQNEAEYELNFKSATRFAAQIKTILNECGCQIAKGYFESRDTNENILLRNNKRYHNKGKSTKEIITMLGRVLITRSYYQQSNGGSSIFPLDENLGVDRDFLMPDMKEVLLYSSANNTPEETSRLLQKCSLITIHPTQVKRTIFNTSNFLETKGTDILDSVREQEQLPQAEIMACSLDGVNVMLNQNGNKTGRPVERPVKQPEVCSSYKNAMCGSIAFYNTEQQDGMLKPKRIKTIYTARMPEDRYPTFKREFEQELEHYEAIPNITKLIITDAHKSISGYLQNNPKFAGYHRIVDFFHASEHLSHTAEALHGKGTEIAKEWYNTYYSKLKSEYGGVLKLVRSIEYYLKTQPLNSSRKKEAQKHLGYFKKHKKYMHYACYLDKGWPIGSGVIEAACKSVVKQRMCRSGQRWSVQGGQAILNLRTVLKSNRWDDVWGQFADRFYVKATA
jgi:hypothetical protein